MTAYLFGMMKIFPSRQPFVALVPRTACQICFSSPSRLRTAAITHTSTHAVCLPTDHNRCAFFSERKRKRLLAFGAPLPAQHLWAELFKLMCTQTKCIILTFSMSLCQKVLSPSSPAPLSRLPSGKNIT